MLTFLCERGLNLELARADQKTRLGSCGSCETSDKLLICVNGLDERGSSSSDDDLFYAFNSCGMCRVGPVPCERSLCTTRRADLLDSFPARQTGRACDENRRSAHSIVLIIGLVDRWADPSRRSSKGMVAEGS